jgi:hypothetical protein
MEEVQMNLKSAHIIDTGPFPAQRFGWKPAISTTRKWINLIGDIQIWKAQVWMGMDTGGRGDFWFRLFRESDGSSLGQTNWDHYSDPTGPHHIMYDYAPNWMDLKKDDIVVLEYGARRWNPIWPPIMRGHVSVVVWYTS